MSECAVGVYGWVGGCVEVRVACCTWYVGGSGCAGLSSEYLGMGARVYECAHVGAVVSACVGVSVVV